MTRPEKDFLEAAQAAARAAGEVLADWRSRFTVREKSRANLVTEADLAAQEVIHSLIHRRFPEHNFLGEEGLAQTNSAGPYRWIIDPLDGTSNYVHGFPYYGVSIALERLTDASPLRKEGPAKTPPLAKGPMKALPLAKGGPGGVAPETNPVPSSERPPLDPPLPKGGGQISELLVGVIFDPNRNELFAAVRGEGATLNGGPIRCSATATLGEAMVMGSLPTGVQRDHPAIRKFLDVMPHVQALQRTGSAALNLAAVACGRIDAFWSISLCPWDMAAGTLLVREAGGRVTKSDGSPWHVEVPDLLATNGSAIHEELRTLLADG